MKGVSGGLTQTKAGNKNSFTELQYLWSKNLLKTFARSLNDEVWFAGQVSFLSGGQQDAKWGLSSLCLLKIQKWI